MVILHSLKILEQLSEIEEMIQIIEKYVEEKDIDIDRDKFLKALLASRIKNQN